VVKVKHHDHDANNPNPAQNNPVGAKLTQKKSDLSRSQIGRGNVIELESCNDDFDENEVASFSPTEF